MSGVKTVTSPDGLTKKCPRCNAAKSVGQFHTRGRHDKRPQSWCKSCMAIKSHENYLDRVARGVMPQKRTPAQNHVKKLKKYGLSDLEYIQMMAAQRDACAICANPNFTERALAVDHNHETGKVRGLLCNSCNRGLGYFKDDPTRLLSAFAYLKERG